MSKWYDLIAGIYDQFSKRTYYTPRKVLVEKLDLQRGDSVLLVGCGTGLIFHFIENKIGETGILVGLDFSKNMLAQAEKKVRDHNWKNVHLIHADARDISPDLIAQHLGKRITFDHAIGELSFSVMPDWKSIMRKSINLIKSDGKFGVLDGHRPKKDWLNVILNVFPQSDISRPISNYLSALTKNYTIETFGRTKIVFVGVGQKMDDENLNIKNYAYNSSS